MLTLATTIATLVVTQGVGAEAGVYDEYVGVRAPSMGGAHRGVGTSNDTLYLNPAGMAIAQRYSLDAGYAFSPFDNLNRFNVSVVDSKSGPVAGGVGYTLVNGDGDGLDANIQRFYGALAYSLIPNLTLGATVRHIRGSLSDAINEDGERVEREVRAWNGDIGLAAQFGSIGAGLVYQNVLNADEEDELFTPRTLGGGISFTTGPLVLAADAVNRIDDDEFSYNVGAEYFLQESYALRAGYAYEPFVDREGQGDNESIVSGGLAYITGQGAVDLGFLRSLERARNWQL
ncbi:MAG: hypothetical protein AAFQ82_16515, partial [Myxococcota bacterium]